MQYDTRRYFRYRFGGNYLTRIRVTVAGALALTGTSYICTIADCEPCTALLDVRKHI